MDGTWLALIGVLWPIALLLVAWAFAEVCVRKPRFSVRTLLVGMTVVAGVLGLVVWAAN